MNSLKIKVMLHYVQQGHNRSPNILFDRMREFPLLQENFDFVTLNQDTRPNEIGNLRLIKDLYQKIKRENPDIIHISGIVEGFHCMVAATLAHCKKRIIITHGFAGSLIGETFRIRIKIWMFRHIFEPISLILATKVQCNSEFSFCQPVIQRFASKKSCLIYNVSPTVDTALDREQLRKNFSINEGDFVFVSAARITKDKGFEEIKDAILQTNAYPNMKFVIIGDGDYLDVLKETLSEEIGNGRVRLLGILPNSKVLEWMNAGDVFLLPSYHFETFGLVYVEAAYQRCASIATNLYAVSEVVQNDKTGILVPTKDVDAVIAAMLNFYEHPELATEMGEEAYQYATNCFSNRTIEKKIFEMYMDI